MKNDSGMALLSTLLFLFLITSVVLMTVDAARLQHKITANDALTITAQMQVKSALK